MLNQLSPWQLRLRAAAAEQERTQAEERAARLAKAPPPPPDPAVERELLHQQLMAESAQAAMKSQAQTNAALARQADEEGRQKAERETELRLLARMMAEELAVPLVAAIRDAVAQMKDEPK